jgi:hypothetical protein
MAAAQPAQLGRSRSLLIVVLIALALVLSLLLAPTRTVGICPTSGALLIPRSVHMWDPGWWTGTQMCRYTTPNVDRSI